MRIQTVNGMGQAIPLPNRLRESREYLGYAPEEIATHLGCSVDTVLAQEAGMPVDRDALRILTRLYLRPAGYLLGSAAPCEADDRSGTGPGHPAIPAEPAPPARSLVT